MAKISQKSHRNTTASTTNKSSTSMKVKRTRKSIPRDSPPQRSSIYRGVTRHRLSGRYEAHLWDKNCWNESRRKKGRQVYLGAYDNEEAAAHAYDLAALKYWGHDTVLNFPLFDYQEELKEMESQSKEEYIGSLRRKSSGFSRGVSKYRGVARHHHNGRWEARLGRAFGNKYLYLGTYATQEEAATAYDRAAIEYCGVNAVTNFDVRRYINFLRPETQDNHENPSNPELNPNPEPELGFVSHHLGSSTGEITKKGSVRSGGGTSTSSTIGILLESSKFKEMLETTSATDYSPTSSESNTLRTFPEDIQTFFESQDIGIHTENDDIIFAELSSFAAYELDA